MKYEYEKEVCSKYDGPIDLKLFSEFKKLFGLKVDQRVPNHLIYFLTF